MRPIRILVAEDNEDHLFFIIRALRGVEGLVLDIDSVRDGEEALDFVYRRGRFEGQPRPHMILLDLKMPKVSGLEVLEQLKSDPDLRKIPISVLTSSDRPEDVEAAYRLGSNSYLRKQSNPSALRQEIAEVSSYWTSTAVLPEPPD